MSAVRTRRTESMKAALACALAGSWPQAAAAERLDAQGLEEVVVTAARRESPLQSIPVSVTALSGEKLWASGVHDIADLFGHVPGLNYTHDGFVGHRLTVRGITSGTLLEPRPLTAFYLDETPMMTLAGSAAQGSFGGPRVQAVDLARVEILRGPQGTLFGTSALGGAVRMITNAPDPRNLYASGQVGYAVTKRGGEDVELDATINIPLRADRLAIRSSGFHRVDGGFTDNIGRPLRDIDDVEISGARIATLWHATSSLTLQAGAERQARTTRGLPGSDVAAGPFEQLRYAPELDDETWTLYSLTADLRLSWADLRSISSYLDRKPEYAFDITAFTQEALDVFNPTANHFWDRVRDFVQEVRLTSRSPRRFSWLLGGYYQHQDHDLLTESLSPGFDALTGGLAASFGYPDRLDHTELDSSLRQRALYGELSIFLPRTWRATVGGRWFEFDQRLGLLFDGFFNGGLSSLHEVTRERGFTPRFGLEFRPSERLLLFANASQGFRPGGANQFTTATATLCAADLAALGIAGAPPPFESDTLWSYELGAKSRSQGGRLVVNVSAYHVDWDDMQTFKNLNCGLGFAENAGRAVSQGFELEVQSRPATQLSLALGIAYTDARLAADVPNVSGEDGERVPTVPEWTASATARYELVLSHIHRLFTQLGYQYVDGAWNDFDQTMRVRTPSRRLVNLRTGLGAESWEAELFVDNALDERVVTLHAKNIVGEWQVLSPPRTVGIRMRMER